MLDFLKQELLLLFITLLSYVLALSVFCGSVFLLAKVFSVYTSLAVVSAATIAFVTMFWSTLNSREEPQQKEVDYD